MTGNTADAFDTVRRFHIFDHEQDEWIMSGTHFGEKGAIVDHKFGKDLEAFDNPEVLVQGRENLTLVWEDGEHAEYDSVGIDDEVASAVCESAASAVAAELDVAREEVRVARIVAPDQVDYVTL